MTIRVSQLHRMTITVASAVIMMVVAAQGQNPPPRTQQPSNAAAPAGNVENGHQLFTKYLCYSCHGSDGQGGAGARLMGTGLPPFDAFRSYLRKPTGGMPPYRSSAIPDAELVDIYAYLKSIPAPAPAKSIPLLNQ